MSVLGVCVIICGFLACISISRIESSSTPRSSTPGSGMTSTTTAHLTPTTARTTSTTTASTTSRTTSTTTSTTSAKRTSSTTHPTTTPTTRTIVTCGNNFSIQHGYWATSKPGLDGRGVTVGAELTFSCNKGYSLQGSAVLTCLTSGGWSAPQPYCILTVCPSIATIPHGNVEVRKLGLEGTRHSFKAELSFSCDPGTRLKGSPTLTCGSNGNWAYNGLAQPPMCSVITCDNITSVYNRFWTQTKIGIGGVGMHTVGAEVTFSCHTGYRLVGQAVVSCQNNSQWSHPEPTCTAILCKNIKSFTNGNITKWKFGIEGDHNSFGSGLKFSCQTGYVLSGFKILTCQGDGRWSSTPPTCKLVKCKPLRLPDNAFWNHNNDTFDYGTTIIFTCMRGFTAIGSAVRKCSGTGLWTGGPFTCKRIPTTTVNVAPTSPNSSSTVYVTTQTRKLSSTIKKKTITTVRNVTEGNVFGSHSTKKAFTKIRNITEATSTDSSSPKEAITKVRNVTEAAIIGSNSPNIFMIGGVAAGSLLFIVTVVVTFLVCIRRSKREKSNYDDLELRGSSDPYSVLGRTLERSQHEGDYIDPRELEMPHRQPSYVNSKQVKSKSYQSDDLSSSHVTYINVVARNGEKDYYEMEFPRNDSTQRLQS